MSFPRPRALLAALLLVASHERLSQPTTVPTSQPSRPPPHDPRTNSSVLILFRHAGQPGTTTPLPPWATEGGSSMKCEKSC
jgi:hypothetical protein